MTEVNRNQRIWQPGDPVAGGSTGPTLNELDDLKRAIEELPRDQQRVLMDRWGLHRSGTRRSLEETAKRWSFTPAVAQELEKRGRETLKYEGLLSKAAERYFYRPVK